MGAVATAGNIRDVNQRAKGIVIKGVSGQEVGVLVIAGRSPEVADLLGTELRVHFVRRAGQGWCGKLQDRQGWCILGEGLGDTCK